MLALVQSRLKKVKISKHIKLIYRADPIPARVMIADDVANLFKFVRPVGFFAILAKPFIKKKLIPIISEMIEASQPDPSPDGGQESARVMAEFLPRFCLAYGMTPNQALAMTFRDIVFWMRVAQSSEAEKYYMKVKLAGGKMDMPKPAYLDSRWKDKTPDAKFDLKIQQALITEMNRTVH